MIKKQRPSTKVNTSSGQKGGKEVSLHDLIEQNLIQVLDLEGFSEHTQPNSKLRESMLKTKGFRQLEVIVGELYTPNYKIQEGKMPELINLCHDPTQKEKTFTWLEDLLLTTPDPDTETPAYWEVDGITIPDELVPLITELEIQCGRQIAHSQGATHEETIRIAIGNMANLWHPKCEASDLLWRVILKNQNEIINYHAIYHALSTFVCSYGPEERCIIVDGKIVTLSDDEIIAKLEQIREHYKTVDSPEAKAIASECRGCLAVFEDV